MVACSPFFVTVLSDQSKRLMYDAGLYDPLEDEDEVRTVLPRRLHCVQDHVKRCRPNEERHRFGH